MSCSAPLKLCPSRFRESIKVRSTSKATDRSVRPTWAVGLGGVEEVPGFAIFFEAAAAAGVAAEGVDADHEASDDGADGDEVPDIGSEDQDGEKVGLGWGIRDVLVRGLPVGVDGVGAGMSGRTGLDFDAPGSLASVTMKS